MTRGSRGTELEGGSAEGGTVLETEVLVIGASASGVCAALQAARMGRRVVLVEPTEWVGGMLTAAGVSAIDGNHALPAGIWGEFQAAVREYYGGAEAVATGWVSNTLFDPRVAQHILRGWIGALPEIRLELGRRCTAVHIESGRVIGATFSDPPFSGGSPGVGFQVRASITIMADEYGDSVAAAGIPWRVGLESRAETGEPEAPETAVAHPQDFTWVATILAPPSGFADGRGGPTFPAGNEYHGILEAADGSWDRFFDYGRLPGDLVMLNWPTQDAFGDYLDHRTRGTVLQRGRSRTARLVRALVEHFGRSAIRTPEIYPTGTLALIPYLREARRAYTGATLTTVDLADPQRSSALRTSIAVGDYPLDHHRSRDPIAPSLEFPGVNAFGVPFGVLVPRDVDGAFVAEKSIGVSGLANGCTRLQPVVMQIGQAAGAAAALCLERGCRPQTLPAQAVQRAILAAGGYLVPACDTKPEQEAFAALQWAASEGYLALRYESEGWVNRGYLDPDAPVSREDIGAAERAFAQGSAAVRRSIEELKGAEERRPTRRQFAQTVYSAEANRV